MHPKKKPSRFRPHSFKKPIRASAKALEDRSNYYNRNAAKIKQKLVCKYNKLNY